MKKLTCEMCGSTDLLKQDGVFVCQTCGCKYSVEEARKMMVEGVVEVSGTVKVDDTDKIDGYLELSKNAYESGNGKLAFEYANKTLEIDHKNYKAWIAKMKSIEFISTVGDLKLVEVMEAGKNAILYAEESIKKEVTNEVYLYEVKRSLELLKLAMEKYSDTAELENTVKRMIKISPLTALPSVGNADREMVNIIDNVAREALAMVELIPDDVLADSIEITRIVGECAKQYQYVTDALIKRFKIYGAELQESAKIMRNNNKVSLENKAKNAEIIAKERQAERVAKYWNAHSSEKAILDNEKAELNKKIKALQDSMEALSEAVALRQIETQISDYQKEKDSLGIFKGKEKKVLQDKIDVLKKELSSAQNAKNVASEPIKKEIEIFQKRISEIDEEFTKDRL